MTEPKPETVAAWTSLVTAGRVVLDHIESALKQAGLPRLDWYDALLEIERAGDEGIRPFELKDRLLLPQYGMSRLLERMAKAGLLAREGVAGDRRGQIVRLTQKGRQVRREMWPVYAAAMMRRVEHRLTQEEVVELTRLLRKLSRS
ncbi:MarR family winged helix-turn-helix transcriptional regulator [Roseobacter sp. YSTF-M11]|uniref:MarR family winged helix-turn-helix transcriptional regulator n=1 Tax=Roseobacter insulae TaxID=2859783 RepID=A0A9X1FVP8_9RHOB|nr:MarR family winged helix-turn-helix transcriptional regulator [Roseobacter insulae]MBW4707965.1 MarR family winged helix-turn-helix transcriptional regulator [Roseobacter insulae]